MSPPSSHRLSVKGIVRDGDEKVLLLKRSNASTDDAGMWDLPGGKVEPGEDFADSLLREVKEETDLDVEITGTAGTADSKLRDFTVVHVIMECELVGGTLALSDEHDEAKWVEVGELASMDVASSLRPFLTGYAGEHGPRKATAGAETIDQKWLHDQVAEFRDEQLKYKQLKRELKDVLKKARDRYAPMGRVDAREKEIQSFAEKAMRKRDKYREPVRQLTDLAGGRIITYTRSEAEAVCRWIENEPGLTIDLVNSLHTRERLKDAEFGYLASHYIVQLTGPEILGVTISAGVKRLKCEIQVATLLQHAWAAIDHDRIYKTNLQVPGPIKRKAAELAALLEIADEAFEETSRSLDGYARAFAASLPPDRIEEQIERWRAVLAADPDGKDKDTIRHRIGMLQLAGSLPQDAYTTLRQLSGSERSEFLRDLGRAAHLAGKRAEARIHLHRAIELNESDWLAHTYLGDIDLVDVPVEALPHYSRAHRYQPEEPRVLVPLVECDLRMNHGVRVLGMMRGSFHAAIEECKRRADLQVHLPQAHLEHGRLALYLEPEEPYEALAAYARAASVAERTERIREELTAIERVIDVLGDDSPAGFVWVREFLRVVLHEQPDMRPTASDPPAPPFTQPLLIVAGGCGSEAEGHVKECEEILEKAFEGFTGTVISGGTTAGISGLVAKQLGGRDGIQLVGYLPRDRPEGDEQHPAYQPVATDGDGYTPLGPIQTWNDLLAQGIRPQDVRVLGVNGGKLAELEYRLALAVGAVVGIVQESGRAAEHMLADAFWRAAPGFAPLPRDWATLMAFLNSARSDVDDDALPSSLVEPAAQTIHRTYREKALRKPGRVPDNVLPWAKLPETLRQSNRHQAAYAISIVRAAGFDVVPVTGEDSTLHVPASYEKRVELMGEMEHGRYNAERLSDGWRLGDTNDASRKTNPTLVAWKDLAPKWRDYDLAAVRDFPEILWRAGLKIVEREDEGDAGKAAES